MKTYVMPSTNDERLRLLAQIERDATEVLGAAGFVVRSSHRETWNGKSMVQLRDCSGAWARSAAIVQKRQGLLR